MTVVVLHPDAHRDLVRHAVRGAPHEVCGVVTRLGRVIELPNVSPWPRVQYTADPGATMALYHHLHHSGEEVAAVWHSHPDGQRLLSLHDVAAATTPLQLLVALRPTGAQVLAYDVSSGEAVRCPLVVGEPSRRGDVVCVRQVGRSQAPQSTQRSSTPTT